MAEPREEVMILLSFRPHDPEFILILLPWCRHTAVEDVTVQLPLPFFLLPNDDVLALVQHIPSVGLLQGAQHVLLDDEHRHPPLPHPPHCLVNGFDDSLPCDLNRLPLPSLPFLDHVAQAGEGREMLSGASHFGK